ncbi:2-succinyl-5-enolpyruvyl-6-hydroxy-3-cyclohexene-1-carboxylic-acid synthase [Lacisediminihabitans changchengi]|uniref:2-succinyl-5-enolpyruvyl-6-hydroxy-3-cyclohexene-1-carboxylate synthase n=1 Tax=Lacisediminihabitans changchengi TaxID=2787634 RepID=A0A934VZD1_9MICO|nr:2-succinyl-5-enolpyruvyl-6-hydroxy-3-cyclohexene-1-carboxylic-acid synthase [Lacisediminihabitans changchengi]MBK4349022.1 2-succinyl-5-enolpyruvyl-6-hydroxy-3-cyclohexene-1-carboxylic-acid synthase [Lacisediminihabitans changchengi]
MPNSSTAFAVSVLAELVARGVRDVVLCPGSRSQALALAAAEFERAGLIRLRVRIDERVAGFLALGLAVETRVPVVVITTSGTAVANLHPAVLEAHHSGVPLVLITADRPGELRGIGSNQTTDQVSIFGSAIRWMRDVDAPSEHGFDPELPGELAHEAYSAAAGNSGTRTGSLDVVPATPGPVQLNLAFREPLSGPVEQLPSIERREWLAHPRQGTSLPAAPQTVVIAGDGAGPEAEQLAHELGVPLLAEVSSGSRFGRNVVVGYRRLLQQLEGEVRRAIVFGHPTLSREIPALLQRDDVEAIVVRGTGAEAYNPGHRARIVAGPISIAGAVEIDREWLGTWLRADRALIEPASVTPHGDGAGALAREQLAAYREPITRQSLVGAVWAATWPHDRLVLGASRLIREADASVPGKKISVHANRGLAGIDGTIATGIGIALASQDAPGSSAAGITRVLLGDLATLYDAGALLFGGGESRPRIQVIVGNDGGGTIFDSLEVAATAAPEPFDRVQFTPQNVDLKALAAAYGWEYRRATNRGELDEALSPGAAPVLVEVPLPR